MAKGQAKWKQETINQKQFEELCHIQCTREEIIGVLGVSKDTLIRWCKDTYGTDFATIYEEKKEGGKASLRRMQWKLAEKNATMGIWLGKNMLGQKDVVEIKPMENRVVIVDDLKKDNLEELTNANS